MIPNFKKYAKQSNNDIEDNLIDYSNYVAESLSGKIFGETKDPNELMDFNIPQHIKDIVEEAVFDYLDNRKIEYVKAECSIVNIDYESYPSMIQFIDHAKRVRLDIPFNDFDKREMNISEIWSMIAQYLPGAVIRSIDNEIDFYTNGPDSFDEHTVLFRDFTESIMHVPDERVDPSMHFTCHESQLIFSVLSYYHVVNKGCYGITPNFNNKLNINLDEDN